jgi:excisionase family DNA binding protein
MENQTLFDIAGVVGYLRRVGASAATTTFVRSLIGSGALPHIKIGKAFYVSRAALDAWLVKAERRARP